MCIVCVQLSLGKLTQKEAVNNLSETVVSGDADGHAMTALHKLLDDMVENPVEDDEDLDFMPHNQD